MIDVAFRAERQQQSKEEYHESENQGKKWTFWPGHLVSNIEGPAGPFPFSFSLSSSRETASVATAQCCDGAFCFAIW